MNSIDITKLVTMLRMKPMFSHEFSVASMREAVDYAGNKVVPLPDIVKQKVGNESGLEIFKFSPTILSHRNAILYLHGGGYCIGSTSSHRPIIERLCADFGGVVYSLDYRLAPEYNFPVPLIDSTAAYQWLLSEGYSSSELAIVGDSAGGGLALSTLINLREEGIPLPSSGVLISPWLDLSSSGNSIIKNESIDPIINKETLNSFASKYLNGALPTTHLASPLFAELNDLPPILLQVGDMEMLFDDSIRLKEKAADYNIQVELKIWKKMVHVWHIFAPILPEGQAAIIEISSFIKKMMKLD